MPGKAMFVQGMAVLTTRRPSEAEVAQALRPFGRVERKHNPESPKILSGIDEWVFPFGADVNGTTIVSYFDRPWPDAMGDVKGTEEEQMTFGFWSMGWFGPMAWPGMLDMASRVARMTDNDSSANCATQHTGFFRVLMSYAPGLDSDQPMWPPGRRPQDSVAEFVHGLSVVEALLKIPGTLAYFNPNGAQLLTEVKLQELKERVNRDAPPVPLGSAARVIRLDDGPGQYLVDLCGINQFRDDIPDIAAIGDERHDTVELVHFIYNIAIYLAEAGPVIKHSHTIDGPGGRWRAELTDRPAVSPQRQVLIFRPDDKKPSFASRLGRLFGRK